MKAAFLIRCSTKKQDYERQVKDLTRLADRLGYTYSSETIYGEHITGKDDASKKDRLSIQHLKEDATLKKFDVVLVSEVSRMSRDPMSGRLYIRQLINMEIPVYFRDINTWTINPETGEKVRDAEIVIGGAFDAAWKYLKSMKTQIASGRRDELDNNCISIGQPFFGYKRHGGKDKTIKNSWVINEEEGQIVVDVFNEYLKDGATLKSTALAMSAKYNKKFSIGRIEHILTYEPYATGVKVINLTDPDTGDVEQFKVTIPTIITKDLYDKVTSKRTTNRVTSDPYPKQTVYTLSKLIKCPTCGHSLTPRKRASEKAGEKYRMVNGKVAISWYCMSGINNATNCKSRISINNEKIEAVIWGLVKQELIGFANLNTEEREMKIENIKTKISNIDADIANYEANIVGLGKLVEKAYNAFLEAPEAVSEMAKERYYQTLKKYQNEKKENEDKISGLISEKEKQNAYLTFYSNPTVPEDAIKKAEADPAEKRRLVKELVYKIYPYKIESYISPATHRVMKNGVVLLLVYTVNGVYNILYDGNQRNDKTAYYISNEFATFQNGLERYELYEAGEYFVLPNADMVKDKGEIEEFVDVNGIAEICKKNNWCIDYSYK